MKKSLAFFVTFVGMVTYAEPPINCRVITGIGSTCDPYSESILVIDKIGYEKGREKRESLAEYKAAEPRFRPIESIVDFLERYIVIEPSKRYAPALREIRKRIDEVIEKKLFGTYVVRKGDTISTIAKRFRIKRSDILKLNRLRSSHLLRIGQRLRLPLNQETIDTITTGKYKIKPGDSLIGIARKFALDLNEIARYNRIEKSRDIYAGRILKLPFDHIVTQVKDKRYAGKFKHRLRVTATAYTSHPNQTDGNPFIAAWNNRLRPGMKAIAVSRDLISRYGLRNGTKVKIAGLPGYYVVKDKMNKRYKRRIDIYMGLDRRRALRWGRRSVVIYW